MPEINIAVTGHRPNKLFGYDLSDPRYQVMKQSFKNFLTAKKATNAITGMALGVDALFALAALELKAEGYPIKLSAYIPCLNHESRWNTFDQHRYHDILRQADEVIRVTNRPYTPECMQQRNIAMVDHADIVLAVWDGTKGGTCNCINYAKQQDRPIYYLTPSQFDQKVRLPEQSDDNGKRLYVAGVTFENPNGESRQELLAYLPKHIAVNLVHTTFTRNNGQKEPAIEIWEKSSGKQIGFIPKDRIRQMQNVHELIGTIAKNKNTWNCTLRMPEKPSGKLYHAVKNLCQQQNLKLPPYDKQIMTAFLIDHKEQK